MAARELLGLEASDHLIVRLVAVDHMPHLGAEAVHELPVTRIHQDLQGDRVVHELKLCLLSVDLVRSQFSELEELGGCQEVLDVVFVRQEHEYDGLGGHLVL